MEMDRFAQFQSVLKVLVQLQDSFPPYLQEQHQNMAKAVRDRPTEQRTHTAQKKNRIDAGKRERERSEYSQLCPDRREIHLPQVERLSAEEDWKEFVRAHKSGKEKPELIAFVPYQVPKKKKRFLEEPIWRSAHLQSKYDPQPKEEPKKPETKQEEPKKQEPKEDPKKEAPDREESKPHSSYIDAVRQIHSNTDSYTDAHISGGM
jgi:hypothetical protein